MAGDWIAMRTDLYEDEAVIGIAKVTALDEFAIIGRLHRLWSFADRQTASGSVAHVTGEWVDRLVDCKGFALAMKQVGWLEVTEGGVSFPNFDRWMSKSAKTRLLDTRNKSYRRNDEKGVRDLSGSRPDKKRTRGEKRRVEKSQGDSPPETPVAADKPPPATAEGAETLRTTSDRVSDKAPDTPGPSKARQRDDLFDAVAEVTYSDPKASGPHIGRVCKLLRSADTPYTPDEVRRWADQVKVEWQLQSPPTLGMLEKHIGRVRVPQSGQGGAKGTHLDKPRCRAPTAEEIAHGDYSGVTGFVRDTKACTNPSCSRAECAIARER